MMNVPLLLLGCTAGGRKSSCDDDSNERLATSKTSSCDARLMRQVGELGGNNCP